MDKSWLNKISRFTAEIGSANGIFLAFPEYRPDLAKAAAHHFDLRFFDFREEVMSQLGDRAGQMHLQELSDTMEQLNREQGLLVFNVESLLASKETAARQRWMRQTAATDWNNPLFIPLMLFDAEASAQTSRILRFEPDELPEQGLISRLRH